MHHVVACIREASGRLRRSAGFSLLVVSLLAVGIGATVAVYSLVHAIVLRPLPFQDPARLVGVQAVNPPKAIVQDGLSVSDARDLASRTRTLSSVGAFRPNLASYTRPGESAVRLVTGLVTPGLLETLGVAPQFGRGFARGDFPAAAERTVLLSHPLWQRLFLGRRDILGQTILLDDEPHTIIGVMPEAFREPAFVDAWLPFPNESGEYYARDSRFWTVIGRLAPGLTSANAHAELQSLAADLAREYPDTNRDWSVAVVPLQELRTRGWRAALWLLFAAVGLVLLIACLNLANLLLARGITRLPELGVRLALGATPHRLALGAVLEGVLLALAGGLLGVGLAALALKGVLPQLPPALLPRAHEVALHPPVLWAAVLLALGSGVACSIVPALHVLRLDANTLLKEGAAAAAGRRVSRWQPNLIAGQVALTVAIVAAALLLMLSLVRLLNQPPGFDPHGLITLRLAPPPARYETSEELARYYDELIAAVGAVPGVASVAVNASAPFSGISLWYPTWADGSPTDAASALTSVYAPVSEEYFRTLRLALRAGRAFTAHDDADGAPVAIVNEAYVRRAFPDGRALGRRILLLPWMGPAYREIVGVVADARQDGLGAPPPAQVYVPQRQMPWFFSTLLVRIERPNVTAAVQAALRAADPTLPFAPAALPDEIAQTALQPRLYATLFAAFAAIALGLSAFGIHSSLRFTISRRTREIGLRVALGATRGRVVRWTLTWTARPVGAGLAVGAVAAAMLALLLRARLYGVARFDAGMLLLLPGAIALLALLSSLPAAWRAARVDPSVALRSD